jgi:hypothetical protein
MGSGNDASSGLGRREMLATIGAGATIGTTGCSLLPGRSGFALEWADGASTCVAPIERAQPVTAFYQYDRALGRASPRDLWRAGRTVTFLYRNTATGSLSLFLVNGAPGSDRFGDGRAILTVEGAAGADWQLLDDPPASPDGGDSYDRPHEPLDGSATIVWRWPNKETDGGVIGPLGEEFDVSLTHEPAGTVDGTTVPREGIGLWLFLDGADPGTPIEVGRFTGQPSRPASIRLSTGPC